MANIKFDAATIVLAKTDAASFDVIFAHFQPRFQRMAETVARGHSGLDEAELKSRYAEALWKVVRAFNPERGDFEHLLNYAIRKASDYVMRKSIKASADMKETSLDGRPTDSSSEEDATDKNVPEALMVASAEAIALADETAVALKERLLAAGATDTDAQAAIYLVSGYTDEQAARLVGRQGTRNTCEVWMNRCKKRIASHMIQAGMTACLSV